MFQKVSALVHTCFRGIQCTYNCSGSAATTASQCISLIIGIGFTITRERYACFMQYVAATAYQRSVRALYSVRLLLLRVTANR
jgi:hypothetical protein